MIQCPNCAHSEYEGTLFCSNCGQPLARPQPRPAAPRPGFTIPAVPQAPPPPVTGLSVPALQLLPQGVTIPLATSGEFSVGRIEEGQAVIPDVDLGPYGGFEAGISRLHAILRVSPAGVDVLDYGSANGTWVNGSRLTPHTPHPVRHGDELRFGELALRVLYPT